MKSIGLCLVSAALLVVSVVAVADCGEEHGEMTGEKKDEMRGATYDVEKDEMRGATYDVEKDEMRGEKMGDMGAVRQAARHLERMDNETLYIIRATNAYRPREVQGEVRTALHGVPASPVDNFTWDGEGLASVDGMVYAELDPVNDRGYMEATWTDEHGEWKLVQTSYGIAPHALGVRFGPTIETMSRVADDPVAARLYMHGDSGGVDPTLPLLFATVGTWGVSEVTLNGEPFTNTYDGPMPNWITHSMLVSGVYNENGVVNSTGSPYSAEMPGEGLTQWDDYEFQFIFLDEPGPEVEGNIPPVASFAYHMVFEDVEVMISSTGR